MLPKIKALLKKNRFLLTAYQKIKKVDPNYFLVGMTTVKERTFWENYGKQSYSGTGEIVDLGCWLGSTTMPLVKGLLNNKNFKERRSKVFAYDLFIWDDWMDPYVKGTSLENKYKPGDFFLNAYKQITSPYEKYIEIRPGDVTKSRWDDGPIEFLLVDLMKSWQLANSVQQIFYPYLIPGKSIIVHQDFSHYYTYWIHLLQYKLKDYFEFVEDIENSGSTAFLLKKKIPKELIQKNYCIEDFSEQDIEMSFAYSLSISTELNMPSVLAAKILCLKDKFGKEVAKEKLKEIRSKGFEYALFADIESEL